MRLPLAAATCLLAMSAASGSAEDPVSLSPKVLADQRLEISSEGRLEGVLDELSVLIDGVEVGGVGIGLEMLFSTETSRTEEVLTAEGGGAQSKRVDFAGQTMEADITSEQGPRTKEMNEAFDLPLNDRSYLLTSNEDGEVQVEDLSDEDLFGDDLEEELTRSLTLSAPFADLLPDAPVLVGDSFELDASEYAGRTMDLVAQCAAALDGWEEMEGPAISVGARWILDEVELEGQGTLREVSEGVAIIDYAMEGSFKVDDLVDMVEEAAGGDAETPKGSTGSLDGEISFKGVGRFDLAAGQLVEIELEGEVAARLKMDVDTQLAAELSAALTYKATLSVL